MKISEVAEKVNLTPVTLRYYERVGLLPSVERKNGVRDYADSDLEWINFIKCMRQVKIPIDDLVEYTKLLQRGPETKGARRRILANELDRLEEEEKALQETIARLKTKIGLYDQGKIN